MVCFDNPAGLLEKRSVEFRLFFQFRKWPLASVFLVSVLKGSLKKKKREESRKS